MTAISQAAPARALQFELKAGVYTLPTLRVLGADTDALDALLSERAARAPEFFRNMPLVIDLSQVQDLDLGSEFAMMIGLIRGYGLVPVGIRGGSATQREQARLMELAVLPESRAATKPKPSVAATPVGRAPAKIVDAPVRSGQRVYARGGDLILLGAVSSGAEVVADGHIHAYAPVRGRLMAGVLGDVAARVFCTDLTAELVSIAGRYRLHEDLDPRYAGRPVQVTLQGETLVFQRL
jgi:septum site-determining protein MinC